MRDYKYYLFDLDGTLTDSGNGIINSAVYAMGKMGAAVPERATLFRFVGPPLNDSFSRYCGFSPEESQRATDYFREYFQDRGMYENSVYAGVPELLERLKKAGKTVILATAKPEKFAVLILRYFGLYKYFDYVAGASMDNSRCEKGQVIAYALEMAGISDRENAVMVGDREHDILGAGENGIDSAGVLYGYGDLQELRSAGADYILENVEDIF